MITISKEDYLKAIAEAEAEGQTVIPATLAHWLSVTRPAVTFALKRLRKDGLVSIKKEGHISLTSQGREIAERTMVRHHLIERMLSEMFGMAWYEIHDEAERLEHAVSPAFEKSWSRDWGIKTHALTATGWRCAAPQNAANGACACSAKRRPARNMWSRAFMSAIGNSWSFSRKRASVRAFALRSRPETTTALFPYR
jgi:Mn-dependent DtxR family transcriptional regulator